MKYIRYIIYLFCTGLLGGGLFGLGKILHLWGNVNAQISLIIGGSVTILVPFVISISNDIGKKFRRHIEIENNYLMQESRFDINVLESIEKVRNEIKEIMNGIVFKLKCFNLEYEDEENLEYVSEDLKNDLKRKQNSRSNSILIEFNITRYNDNMVNIRGKILKENQFIGFSNSDNEELGNIVVEKLATVLTFAPRPPGVRREGRKV